MSYDFWVGTPRRLRRLSHPPVGRRPATVTGPIPLRGAPARHTLESVSDGDPLTGDEARQVMRARQFMRIGLAFVVFGLLWMLLVPFVRHGPGVWWSMPGMALLVMGAVCVVLWISGGRR